MVAAQAVSSTGPAGVEALRHAMVDCQLRTYDVTDKAVLAAMDTVPREAFLPGTPADIAYLDRPARIAVAGADGERHLLTPMVLARMLQALALQPGETLLDYASGGGYSAAVAAEMGAEVVACERDAALRAATSAALAAQGRANITVVGEAGASAGGFDAILVNGACEQRPDSLLALLKDGGRLVCVLGPGRAGRAMLYRRHEGHVSGRAVFDAAAEPLPEFSKPAEFVF